MWMKGILIYQPISRQLGRVTFFSCKFLFWWNNEEMYQPYRLLCVIKSSLTCLFFQLLGKYLLCTYYYNFN